MRPPPPTRSTSHGPRGPWRSAAGLRIPRHVVIQKDSGFPSPSLVSRDEAVICSSLLGRNETASRDFSGAVPRRVGKAR